VNEALKLRPQAREIDPSALEVRKEGGKTTLTFPASSETPVERWWGEEVLSHDKGAIRLDRVKRGAMPLLFNHDMNDPIGIVDAARIEGGRLVVDAHLFDTERSKEVAQMLDGGLRNVSIGYRINVVEEDKKTNRFTATDWEPYEVSIVTVPADPTVGLGRGLDGEEFEVRMVRASKTEISPAAAAANSKESKVDNEDKAAAGASAELEVRISGGGNNAAELEQGRITAITNLSKACNIDDSVRQMWITGGTSVDKVSDDIMQIVAKREANNPKVATAIGLTEKEAKKFSFARALLGSASDNWKDAGFELECSRAVYGKLGRTIEQHKFMIPYEAQVVERERMPGRTQQRDLTVATASAGGYLVGTQNQSFVELLRNRTVAYRMGAVRLPGLVGNVTIPKQTGAATAVWLANEASTLTESAQTFGQLALTPKSVGAYVELSRLLLLQSQPAAEQLAMTDIAAVASIAVDLGVLNGSGVSGQPTGIIQTAGIGAFTGTTLGAVGVLDAQADVIGSNVVPLAPGYVTTAAVAALLMARPELPTTGTTRLWQGSMLDGSMFGVPATVSAQMSSATALFGDWSKVVVGEWGALEIETNPYANFQAGIIGVRAIITIDVGVRYAGAWSYSSSIT
jgi:HK97 family phage major capsid protein/HK97 family phage prohead protease